MSPGALMTTLTLHAAAWGVLLNLPRKARLPPRSTVSVSVVYRKPPPAAVEPAALPAPPPLVRKRARRRAAPKPAPAPVAAPPALLTAAASAVPAAAAVVIPVAPPAPAADPALPQVSEAALPEGYVKEGGFSFAPLYRVTEPPRLLKPLQLKYPDRAREFQKEGVVIVEIDIDAQGRVISSRVIEESGWGFGDAALKAIKEAVFRPAKIGETAVPVRYRVPIRFKMDFS